MEPRDHAALQHGRNAPLEMSGEEFRRLGHALVDQVATFMDGLRERQVTPGETAGQLRALVGSDSLPERGVPTGDLLEEATRLLVDHSLFNGHPKFWGYITSSAAPIGALADMLAAAVNPNVGAAILSPIATEIEAQTVRWIADLIGYPRGCGGLLVSGGNMANFVCFLAARKAKVPWDVHGEGLAAGGRKPVVYVSSETHTWIDKAAELFGLGAGAVRWIVTNGHQQIDLDALQVQIHQDIADGHLPIMVVGTAGTVSTGATDPLPGIAEVCRQHGLWFHVDGAYGAPAVMLPDASTDLKGLREADSVALDPHKWLYSPLEAGCALVRDPRHLVQTFSHHPAYYNFDAIGDEPQTNYYEFGMQNSRGFRALKVWLAIRQVGREGYIRMIGDDVELARAMAAGLDRDQDLEVVTRDLSITTFRYVPTDLPRMSAGADEYLNALNEAILNRMQKDGEAFVSNAMVDGRYLLRACIVNFRSNLTDVEALAGIVTRAGREADRELRPKDLSA